MYTDAFSTTNEGNIQYTNPCAKPSTFTVNDQDDVSNVDTDKFTGGNIDLFLATMDIAPNCCTLTYSCVDIAESGEDSSSISCSDFLTGASYATNLDGGDNIISDGVLRLLTPAETYGAPYRPGTYTMTIKGQVNEAAEVTSNDDPRLITSKTTTFTFTLQDPCDPPDSLTLTTPTMVASDYYITDGPATATAPVFTIGPDFCPFDVVPVIGDVSNGVSVDPITPNGDGSFTIDYSADLSIVDATQSVTITATSKSEYPYNTDSALTATDGFTITYRNPCLNEDYVTWTQPAQTSPGSDKYTGVPQIFDYVPYSIVPALCTLTITCEGVTKPDDSYTGTLVCPSMTDFTGFTAEYD